MATDQEIKKSLARLMSVFAIYTKDQEAIKAFAQIVIEKLRPFPNFIIERAVEKIIETSSFMPKIAEMLSYCWGERDKEMHAINAKFQKIKDDWYADKVHPLSDYEAIRDEYLAVNAETSAKNIMDAYEKYGKPAVKLTDEQRKIVATKMRELGEKLSMRGA